MVKLVIFDCDGVLVDTEEVYFNMNREYIRQNGGDFDLKYYEHFIGSHSQTMWSELKEKFNLPGSVEALIENEKEKKKIALSKANLRPIAGVTNLINTLQVKGITCAVASSGRRDNVNLILDKIGLREKFKAIIAGEDVMHGKPAPDIFLKAASECGFHAAGSVVIEDSHNGARGAKAAGMGLVGYINRHSGEQDLSLADLRISSFTDPALTSYLGLA